MRDSFISKIVLSNSPSRGSPFVALAIIGKWGVLAYCKSDQNSWNLIEEARYFCEDVTFMNGLIYGLHKSGAIAVCDISGDSPAVRIIGNPETMVLGGVDMRYLLNAMGELLMVTRFIVLAAGIEPEEELRYTTIKFQVFRFNFSGSRWERLMNLGDKVLFLGENASLALSASDYPGCRGNRIYFTDDFSEEDFSGIHGEHDTGIFNLDDGIFEPLPSCPQDSRSRLLWPSPVWITPNPC